MDNVKVKNPIYPILSILIGIIVLVIGLVLADYIKTTYFLLAVCVLFVMFGYYKSILAIVPFMIIMVGFFSGVTYAISKDVNLTLSAGNRIFAVCVAIIPGFGMQPIALVRNLQTIHTPRMLVLGMMISLSFFPLLKKEIKKVREAMKTRGAGSILNLKVFYRAFLVPLIVRLINITDTLSLSVETRCFNAKTKHTIYKKVIFRLVDFIFFVLFLVGVILLFVL